MQLCVAHICLYTIPLIQIAFLNQIVRKNKILQNFQKHSMLDSADKHPRHFLKTLLKKFI